MKLVLCALFLFFVTVSAGPNRIFGGQVTSVEEYPSIVQVESYFSRPEVWDQWCGANVLNALYVLSAAHCFYGPFYHRPWRRIRAGSSYRQTGGMIVYIVKEINHPSFDFRSADGDISIILLTSPLIMSPVIQPASILRQNAVVPDNVPVVTAGWGAREDWTESPVLLHVTTFTVNRELCHQRYINNRVPRNVTENMLCSSILDVGGKGSCGGDSGGPVYFGNVLVGIVSWGEGCAHPTYPSVSTRVASYTDWIVETAV